MVQAGISVLTKLKVTFDMVELRDYQQEAVEFLVSRKRAFVQAPAGSGKTLIAAAAVARVARPGQRVLWLANTKEQVEQGIAAIRQTEGAEEVEFEVCCVASNPDAYNFDIVIFDEAHHAPAETWLRCANRTNPETVLWGFSATPWHEDEARNDIVRQVFGEFFTVDRRRVEDAGYIEQGKVYIHDVDTRGQWDLGIDVSTADQALEQFLKFRFTPYDEHARRVKWQITQDYIQLNEARNDAIVRLAHSAANADKSVLLLVASIEHGGRLAERLPGAMLVHSKVGAKARRNIIGNFRTGFVRTLVATSLADEGLDVPRAAVLVLASGGRSAGKLEQRAGRVLRPHPGKAGGVIHDFLDTGACFALAQARARFKIYDRLGYAPEIVSYK